LRPGPAGATARVAGPSLPKAIRWWSIRSVSPPGTFVDNYQTPHTEQPHVVERFRMVDAGKTLEVNVHVEDPGAFTTPWNAIQRYRRVEQGPMIEMACAENNDDHFHHEHDPMPQADKPDF
jgi:hypothetical protein